MVFTVSLCSCIMKKRERSIPMVFLRKLFFGLVMVGTAVLMIYLGPFAQTLTPRDFYIGLLVMTVALYGIHWPEEDTATTERKSMYQKPYQEYIQSAFSGKPKQVKKFYQALENFHYKDYATALEKFQKLRRKCRRPDDICAVCYFCAMCCTGLHNLEDGISYYREALRVCERDYLYKGLGDLLVATKQSKEGIAVVRRAIQLNDKDARTWHILAIAYLQLKDFAQALECYKKVLEIDPTHSQAIEEAVICSARLGDITQFEKYYDMAKAAGCRIGIMEDLVFGMKNDKE